MVRRTTANPGDRVYVTGSIGDAALGLALRRGPQLQMRWGLDDAAASYLVGRFSRPRPPVALLPALRSTASAALDVSDGLIKDFDRLCRASGVAGTIEASHVPLSDAAQAVIMGGGARIDQLLTGGEDYEVLATVASSVAPEFERLAAAVGTRVSCIGIVTTGDAGAVTIAESGAELVLTSTGWDHFLQP
jgi:thiamine-monophosphate kinase